MSLRMLQAMSINTTSSAPLKEMAILSNCSRAYLRILRGEDCCNWASRSRTSISGWLMGSLRLLALHGGRSIPQSGRLPLVVKTGRLPPIFSLLRTRRTYLPLEVVVEIACLDLEGVLVPEIWIEFAKATGIDSLKATTRDIPDYDVLMKQRLRILEEHNLGLKEIQEVIATLKPLDGAVEFVDWLRERFQVIILSDTFYEFSQPLMRQLGFPTLFC